MKKRINNSGNNYEKKMVEILICDILISILCLDSAEKKLNQSSSIDLNCIEIKKWKSIQIGKKRERERKNGIRKNE